MCLKTVPANSKTPNVIDLMNREKSPPVWKNSRNFAMPSLVSPRRNDFWGTCPEIPYRLRVTTQICVVLLIGCIKFSTCQNYYPDLGSASDWFMPWGKFDSTNQKHYPDLGSDGSSVWNVCSHSSDVISRGNQCGGSRNVSCLLRLM